MRVMTYFIQNKIEQIEDEAGVAHQIHITTQCGIRGFTLHMAKEVLQTPESQAEAAPVP